MSDGHAYEWHDGRLHALASVALNPGASFVGRWQVPFLVDGRLERDLGRALARGQPVDCVVLADRGGAGVCAGGVSGAPARRLIRVAQRCSDSLR